MNKKLLIAILVIVILTIGFGVYLYNQNNITVGDVTYKVPSGYKTIDNTTYVTVTNGKNTVYLEKTIRDKNISKYINYYISTKSKNNIQINITNFTTNNLTIYKSNSVNESSISHYWFNINGKTYEIFTDNKNLDTDNLVKTLIETMEYH